MGSSGLDSQFAEQLEQLDRRQLRRGEPAERFGLDFTSNDYLGLRHNPKVLEAMAAALPQHGAGSGASRLLGGSAGPARLAEEAVAGWLGAEDALLFGSGYQANLGVLSALAGAGDTIVSDRLCHASLIDGARLSRARVLIFDHNDPEHAEYLLAHAPPTGRRLLVTEGLFSMDGDVAPVAELAQVCQRQDAWLVLDEAHSIGVLGPTGQGAWANAARRGPLPEHLAVRIVACGKALGLCGAFAVGSRALRSVLLNSARSLIFSTAPPPAVCAGLKAAVEECSGATGQAAREALFLLRQRLGLGLRQPIPAGPIVPIQVGSAARALRLSETLAQQGLDARAVRPPTVPEGSARLRVVLRADHSRDDVDQLVRRLGDEGVPVPVSPVKPRAQVRRSPAFVIFGTDTDVGKTVASAACALAAEKAGAVTYWKPVQTGDDSDTAEFRRLTGHSGCTNLQPTFEFPLPASPHEAAADAGSQVELDALDRALEQASAREGTLILEPAGGLCVPLTDDTLFVDWIQGHRPDGVLVARSALGTLNHTLLSLEALRRRGIHPRALILVGPEHKSNAATLRRHVPRLFELPPLHPLDPDILQAWVDSSGLAELFLR